MIVAAAIASDASCTADGSTTFTVEIMEEDPPEALTRPLEVERPVLMTASPGLINAPTTFSDEDNSEGGDDMMDDEKVVVNDAAVDGGIDVDTSLLSLLLVVEESEPSSLTVSVSTGGLTIGSTGASGILSTDSSLDGGGG